jgi:hypothetical protein
MKSIFITVMIQLYYHGVMSGILVGSGPGHGLLRTLITFPLSSDLLLLGTFEKLPTQMNYDAFQVADANTHIAKYSKSQIYARSGDFKIHVPAKFFASGNELPSLMIKTKKR